MGKRETPFSMPGPQIAFRGEAWAGRLALQPRVAATANVAIRRAARVTRRDTID